MATSQEDFRARQMGWRRQYTLDEFVSLEKFNEFFRGPTELSNWVVPGRIMAGAFPGCGAQNIEEFGETLQLILKESEFPSNSLFLIFIAGST
jgi:hypothetical protein